MKKAIDPSVFWIEVKDGSGRVMEANSLGDERPSASQKSMEISRSAPINPMCGKLCGFASAILPKVSQYGTIAAMIDAASQPAETPQFPNSAFFHLKTERTLGSTETGAKTSILACSQMTRALARSEPRERTSARYREAFSSIG